jgi:hypothetical protein
MSAMLIGDAMSNRSFIADARNYTREFEDYLAAIHRLGSVVLEAQAAVQSLAQARDALLDTFNRDDGND